MPEKWYELICNGVNKDRHIIYLNDIYKSWQGPTVPQTMYALTSYVLHVSVKNIDYIFKSVVVHWN